MSRASLRAFISYSTKDKHQAAEVKAALRDLGVECFLAHDDIRVSEEWKERILEELATCDVLIPLLSKAFRESDWTAQEVGYAFARRDILIIPLSLDATTPYGLISHVQRQRLKTVTVSPDLFRDPILKRFPRVILPRMIDRVANAWSYRNAEDAMKPLMPVLKALNKEDVNALARAAVSNNQVWSASRCRTEYLPAFVKLHRKRIDPALLKALEYQVENDEVYSPE